MAAPARLRLRRVVGRAAAFWRREWLWLTGLALAITLPLGAVEALLEHADVETLDTASFVTLLGGTAAILAVHTLGDLFLQGVVAAEVTAREPGRARRGLWEVARTVPYGRLIAVDVLVAIGFAFGALLLFVPAIVFLTFFWLTPTVVEIEHRRVFAAFRRSAQLVRGQFWRVLLVLGVVTLLDEVLAHGAKDVVGSFLGDFGASVAVGAVVGPIEALLAVMTALELMALTGARTDPPLPDAAAPGRPVSGRAAA